VRERALALLAEAGPAPARLLDVGAGTGALVAGLLARQPALRAAAVDLAPGMCAAARAAAPRALVAAADAEALPFRAGTFDAVVSTSTLQWLPRLGPSLGEARRVLAPGGVLCVALFGARTLRELLDAFRGAAGADAATRTHRFLSREDVGAALAEARFRVGALLEEELVLHHPDARAVLRDLKALGASAAVPGRRGLGGRAATLETLRRYEAAHRGPDGVPVTWHVVYALARRTGRGEG
jgi:malonyl-CoA O-methyltransferase